MFDLKVQEKSGGRSTDKIQVNSSNSSNQVAACNDGVDTAFRGYPVTDFTPHVLKLLELVDLDNQCVAAINLNVTAPDSVPTVECPSEKAKEVGESWCFILKRTFIEQRRTLPSSIALSFSRTDRMHKERQYRCFESSSQNGEFCMTNFLEAERMKNGIEYPTVPWENRVSVPIWRGTPWMKRGDEITDPTKVYEDALSRSPRLQVIAWSYDHPDLLDAKIAKLQWLRRHPYWENRTVNGMDKLYPVGSFIAPEDYYTQYQVALVLGGIGAAFRLSIHLSTETAVVLQEWQFKEWFTPMMIPYQHYIPLAEDLSDLYETMHWVKKNPAKVRQIAENGKGFMNGIFHLKRTKYILPNWPTEWHYSRANEIARVQVEQYKAYGKAAWTLLSPCFEKLSYARASKNVARKLLPQMKV
jgi:hypothetical protein